MTLDIGSSAGVLSTVFSRQSRVYEATVVARLRQLNLLFEEGLLTDDFYLEKVAECEAGE